MSDFPYKPDKTIREKIEFATDISTFSRHKEQRQSKVDDSRRQWGVQFFTRTQTEMENVRDFFISKKGAYAAFTWTNPNDSTEYTVRYLKDSFDFERMGFQIYDFSFSLQQVL